MRIQILPILVCMLFSFVMHAEGTRETAPNGSITVEGNPTNDIAALLLNDTRFNTFASYDNPDENSRLYVHITDPTTECIYLGFSYAHPNANAPNPPAYNFEYRIKDPNGNVVYGPIFVTQATANIQNWSEAVAGPQQLVGASGYDAMQVTPSQLGSQGWSGKGDYYIEFSSPSTANEFLIDYWDVTVVNCATSPALEKKGRLWTYNWAIFAVNDYGFPNRPFNGAFYVCAPDPDNPDAAFITKIDFNGAGFQPAAFNVAFNSFGVMNTGNVTEDRRSVENMNLTQEEYPIFLNDPVDICETGEPGEIELLGVGTCDGSSFCIEFEASKKGQVDLILDFDGADGVFTPGTADLMIARNVEESEIGTSSCIEWDGRDGLGNLIPQDAATTIPVILAFAQGVYHFPVYDAEFMINGFNIQAVRPASDQPLLYYDDSQLSMVSGSGEPAVQLMGCVLPCHRWTNFINNQVVGFGNVSTINSWWFSQLSVREEVFLFPGRLDCKINGATEICAGSVGELTVETVISPQGAENLEIASIEWSGPNVIGAADRDTISIGSPGLYNVELFWINDVGDTCQSSCAFEVSELPSSSETIDTLIVSGESVTINNETYNEGGEYVQFLTAANGCDSMLTVLVRVIQSVVHYDMDACISYTDDGSSMDYTEFTAAFPEPLSCATITASIAERDHPEVNMHSCTPGVNDSPAICISSLEECDYVPGSDKSLIFELTISPAADTAVAVTGLSFFEKAPETFDWIDGNSGFNSYPQSYGIRVLKDGVEIYVEQDIPTTTDWTEEVFDFSGVPGFVIEDESVFRFELLGYCIFNNNSPITAWDLDEISVQASCAPTSAVSREIEGTIITTSGFPLQQVELQVRLDNEIVYQSETNDSGAFAFDNVLSMGPYEVSAYKNDDMMNGVSTLDLVRIQRHLLNIEPFDQSYQFIAADANRNNAVSAIDLVELRKLILGIYEVLPNNTSWRFGHPDLTSLDADEWELKERVVIDHLDTDLYDLSFTGIKIGDVDGSHQAITDKANISNRSNQKLIFPMADREIHAGQSVIVDFKLDQLTRLHGLQMAISAKGIADIEVVPGRLASNSYLHFNEETIRFNWYDGHGVGVSAGEVLFSLRIHTKENKKLSEVLTFDQSALPAEAYVGQSLEEVDISIEFDRETQILDHRLIIVPNPSRTIPVIYYEHDREDEVLFQMFDATGKRVGQLIRTFGVGASTVSMDEIFVPNVAGVYTIRVLSDDRQLTEKFIYLKE